MQLIVGLGNPGPAYEKTRHNAGFWFLDNLASRYNCTFKVEKRFSGRVAAFSSVESGWLFCPTTFMNLSGQAVQAISQFYRISPQHILVAHDDLDLPVGDVRLKMSGGHGGHNGLRDIIQRLGTNAFARLRIGIGHPGNKEEVHNYVLGNPRSSEREAILKGLENAMDVMDKVLAGDFQKAMTLLNTR